MSKTGKKIIIVYTDGSCVGNGRTDAVGGIGIHFPNGELKDISKIYRLGLCTNQKTELYAILTAIKYIKQNFSLEKYKLIIKTDSQYSINCVTKWINGWMKNGWVTQSNKPVVNKEMIETIHKYYVKYDIDFDHVDAHTNGDDEESVANAKADKLATNATKKAYAKKKSKTKTSGSKSTNKKTASAYKKTKPKTFSANKLANKSANSLDSFISYKQPNGFNTGNFIVELVKNK